MPLKFSVSGLRGIWNDGLSFSTINSYLLSFLDYISSKSSTRKRLVLGRDTRKTSPIIYDYVSSVARSVGFDIVNLGIVTTPIVLFVTREIDADGGIIVTASHNPPEWNALKFVDRGGMFINETTVSLLSQKLGKMSVDDMVSDWYFVGEEEEINSENVLNMFISKLEKVIDIGLIKSRKFKVAFDPVNGAGALIGREFLKRLGCEIMEINCDISKFPERPTEPNSEALSGLSQVVVENRCDIGFALDPDGDRLVFVTEKGEIPGEEYTLPISILSAISFSKVEGYSKKVVVNLSSSMLNDYVASKFGFEVLRSKVGEANVVKLIKDVNGFIGGEGNGGVVFPVINSARDSFVGIALILQLMAKNSVKISEVISHFPKYEMVKLKFEGNLDKNVVSNVIGKVLDKYSLIECTNIDGYWYKFDKGWIHVRASNTEPVTRVVFEGDHGFVSFCKELFL